jgi:putative ABC transport system permease protein
MARSNPTFHFRFWLWLIRIIGVIVPRRLRADWRHEWEAELCYRETLLADWDNLDWRNKLALLWHSLGAFMDALWLQPRRWEDEMMQDLRYGVRMLAKSKVFTLVAILTLSFGIGANTAIFSVVYAVLLSPLPYPQAERIVAIGRGQGYIGLTGPEFVELRKQNQVFELSFISREQDFILTGRGAPEQFKCQRISQELFPFFGVQANPGRAFSAEEFQAGNDRVVLISHRLWQSRWAANPNLIGQSVTLNQKIYTVVGIIPPNFNFFPETDLLVPWVFDADELNDPNFFAFNLVARLKPGITIERAQRELNAINSLAKVSVYPLRELLVRDFRPTLFVLWGLVGLVLLIACANFANLLLARAANRQKEFAIRMAIGARRFRIVRQLLIESVLLAILGGAVGLLFAHVGVDALLAAGPVNLPHPGPNPSPRPIPRLDTIGINGWVIAFTFGVSLLTGVIFGLALALRLSKPDLNSFLKEGAAVSAAGFRHWRRLRLQSLLVMTEIALALVLLIGAGLLVRSFWRTQQITLGFQPERLLTIHLQFPWYRFRNHSQVVSFIGQITEYLEATPGVQSVSASSSLPLIGGVGHTYFIAEEPLNVPPEVGAKVPGIFPPPPPPKDGRKSPQFLGARTIAIGPRYFQTMRIPVKGGREFEKYDSDRSMPVVVVNETMARRYWAGKDPIGQRIQFINSSSTWKTIVGVVGDSLQYALEDKAAPTFYLPLPQSTRRGCDCKESEAILTMVDHMGLMVRTTREPGDLINAVQKQVWSLDPDQPALQVAAMEDILNKAVAIPRFNVFLFGVFAGVALLLAAIGIYGLMAYLVTQRTHEIGIRLALGAQKSDVLFLVMKHGMKLAVLGIVIGLGVAFGLTRVIRSWLFGVSATDPLTFAGIIILLTGTVLLACYLPALRATKVDPLVALRHE